METTSFIIGFKQVTWLLSGLAGIVGIGLYGLWRLVFQDWQARLKLVEKKIGSVMEKQYGHEYLNREAANLNKKLDEVTANIKNMDDKIIDIYKQLIK